MGKELHHPPPFAVRPGQGAAAPDANDQPTLELRTGEALSIPSEPPDQLTPEETSAPAELRSAADEHKSDHLVPAAESMRTSASHARPPSSEALEPQPPTTLKESGLTLAQLTDLILKLVYLHGGMLGSEIAGEIRLPFGVIEGSLSFLKQQRCLEVTAGQPIGPVSQRFVLTEFGRIRARDAFEHCRYVGPAPVPLHAYAEQCRRQSVVGITCSRDELRRACGGLVVDDQLLEELGVVLCSGRSLFFHGPPGNGKTALAKALGRFLNESCGAISVPYAILVDGAIITVFDPAVHKPVETTPPHTAGLADDLTAAPNRDGRWRQVRRPVVIVGGELTLEMLDLKHNPNGNFYTAPMHIKANGGAFVVDDFGRQAMEPRQLLNRWILPLEERTDYLSLATGKQFAVPFEQLTVFSTNIDPATLVDDAFLRRVRHKVFVGPPTRNLYADILRNCCRDRGVAFQEQAVAYLFDNHYNSQRLPRASDPRDLLEIATAVSRFNGEALEFSDRIVGTIAPRFFRAV